MREFTVADAKAEIRSWLEKPDKEFEETFKKFIRSVELNALKGLVSYLEEQGKERGKEQGIKQGKEENLNLQ